MTLSNFGGAVQSGTVKGTVNLPQINLKKFSGNPLEWQSLWDLFKSSIDDRRDAAEPAKF